MSRHVLTVPNWTPPRLNQVRGRHWSIEHRAKKQTAELLRLYAIYANIPPANCKRSAAIIVTLSSRQKQPDRDAYDKILLDALVRAGLLMDDSDRGLHGRLSVEFHAGGGKQTLIILEDIP